MSRAIALLFLVVPAVASATTIVALPFREMVGRANTVALVQIIRSDTFVKRGAQGGANGDRIVTVAKGQALSVVRGVAAGDVIPIESPGGELRSGLRAFVPGAPKLEPGGTYFLVLGKYGDVYRPLGMSYGVFRVFKDAEGVLRASRQLNGLTMVHPDGSPAGMQSLVSLPLSELMTLAEGAVLDGPGTTAPATLGETQP